MQLRDNEPTVSARLRSAVGYGRSLAPSNLLNAVFASLFKGLGWFGFLSMFSFITALIVALAYCWKKGALEWES